MGARHTDIMEPNLDEITNWFRSQQQTICRELTQLDGGSGFREDSWTRPGGGGGLSNVISNGNLIEKGGVNYSHVFGKTPEKIRKALDVTADHFHASGVSIVLHPVNPFVPIIHMNIRYFQLNDGTWWFGGGIDLTPHYIVEEDAVYFHRQLKFVCDETDPSYYTRFKNWADDYFYLKHRKETRGIGGIFFDRLSAEEFPPRPALWEFVKQVGSSFVPIYAHVANRHRQKSFTQEHKKWQQLRRGRYVEFNLVWDKGTKFGLDTEGRTESILMSMPPQAHWTYDYIPDKESHEAKTLELLKKGINWIAH